MKLTIPLEKAIRLLNESSAIIVDNDFVIYAGAEITSHDEPFMELAWDYEDEDYGAVFYPEDNEVVNFAGGSIWLTARTEEAVEEYQITLLEPMNLDRIVADMEVAGYDVPLLSRVIDAITAVTDGQSEDYPELAAVNDELCAHYEQLLAARSAHGGRSHSFTVVVSGCDAGQAARVMSERLGHDEDYGFTYSINF